MTAKSNTFGLVLRSRSQRLPVLVPYSLNYRIRDGLIICDVTTVIL